MLLASREGFGRTISVTSLPRMSGLFRILHIEKWVTAEKSVSDKSDEGSMVNADHIRHTTSRRYRLLAYRGRSNGQGLPSDPLERRNR